MLELPQSLESQVEHAFHLGLGQATESHKGEESIGW